METSETRYGSGRWLGRHGCCEGFIYAVRTATLTYFVRLGVIRTRVHAIYILMYTAVYIEVSYQGIDLFNNVKFECGSSASDVTVRCRSTPNKWASARTPTVRSILCLSRKTHRSGRKQEPRPYTLSVCRASSSHQQTFWLFRR